MKKWMLLLALVACHHAPAPKKVAPPTPLQKELDAYLESFGRNWGERHKMNGYVLVAQHDEVLYGRGFGAGPDTSFRIGSVTKQFTAAAILVLQQDGELSTADSIATYLPDYPEVGASITLRQLLDQTSGLPNYTENGALMAERAKPHTVAQLLASFDELPLHFPPGTSWEYSNSNYIVLGAILEKVSGMSYAEFLRTRLFEPAGMKHSVVGDDVDNPDRALGFRPSGDQLQPAEAIDMSVPFAAGAVRSTANDLVRWHRALEGDAILSADSKRELYTPGIGNYAYGWVVEEIAGHQTVHHNGGIDGFTSGYLRVPDLDLVIVALSNTEGIETAEIAQAALHAVLGEKLSPFDEPVAVPLDRAEAEKLIGTWVMTEGSQKDALGLGLPQEALDTIVSVTFTIENDHLIMTPAGQPPTPLDPTSSTTYYRPELGLTMKVENGVVTLMQGGASFDYVKN